MRSLATVVFRRCLLLGLLAGSLGACQRTAYQLQPIESVAYQAIKPASAPESAVVTIAAPAATPPIESRQRLRRPLPRFSQRPQLPRVAARRGLVRSAAAARTAAVAAPRLRQEPAPQPVAQPVRHRSRGVAIVLAALAITYLPLSLHNFYLGYYGRGVAAIALMLVGLYLVLLGLLGSIFSGAALTGFGVVGVAMLGGWFIWQLSDLVRIITKDLRPKNGEYNARLFQLKSDANSLTAPPRTD